METRVDRISISYDLTFETLFHCGTGLRTGLIDRTIIRDHNNYLYVPGSTVKGVVREHCERLARMYSEQDQAMSDLIDSPHNARQALFELGQRIPMTTRIFGSHYHPGHLFFEDAHQHSNDKKQYDTREKDGKGKGKYKGLQTDLYTQVRLDRLTRTAVSGALYTSEFGVRDLTMKGNINGWLECIPVPGLEQGPTYSLLLLLAGLHLLDRIGGNKSTGKGKCRCEITGLIVENEQFKQKKYMTNDWQDWFEHLDVLTGYAKAAAELMEEEV